MKGRGLLKGDAVSWRRVLELLRLIAQANWNRKMEPFECLSVEKGRSKLIEVSGIARRAGVIRIQK